MASAAVTVVPDFDRVPTLHARALPQKDNLCGAFWGALALRAAGVEAVDGGPVDQDLVAVHAGTSLPGGDPRTFVPRGTLPRRDYRLPIPRARDVARSGTSPAGLARAIRDLGRGALAVVPVAGPWSAERVVDLVDAAAEDGGATMLLANVRTGALWGSRAPAPVLLAHLAGRPVPGPEPEWDVGHFVSPVAVVRSAAAALVLVRDTYPTLGWRGYHLQPPEALAAALVRGDGREGGILCVVRGDASGLGRRLEALGYELRYWDNGTPDPKEEG